MNETVLKLVNMLFSETEMTQEAQALRDELLANCRERFDDAVAEGKTEDEAIGCVVESLKGMEEVIGSYPKKRAEMVGDDPDEDDNAETAQSEYSFDGGEISALDIDVRETDIEIESVLGDRLTVSVDEDAVNAVSVTQSGNSIRISAADASRKRGTFGWLLDLVTSFSGSGTVKIGVPDGRAVRLNARTVSGDISVSGVELASADASSASGSITLKPSPAARLSAAKANTASGDIHISLAADTVSAKTMSGEIRATCDARELVMSTLSGDVKVKGAAESAKLKSVSGDLRFKCLQTGIKDIEASTTSGDTRLKLPVEVGSVHMTASTVTGDVKNEFDDCGAGSEVSVRASSVSGDISVIRKES